MLKIRKLSGIICEFNPLHQGHRYILEYSAQWGHPVVCVLSGNFVQRGEPAILDKWSRTRLALENGANLVIELPLPWAMAGAERFAAGAVYLLCALGFPGRLIFGSEAGETETLCKIADILLAPAFSAAVSAQLANGSSFAKAREKAVSALLGNKYGALLQAPNNILAIEYIKALRKNQSPLTPQTLLRQGAAHDAAAVGNQLRSAGELRQQIHAQEPIADFVPESTAALLARQTALGLCPAAQERLASAILAKLRTMGQADFAALPDISEGLENRLYQAARKACSVAEFYTMVKSKRYSHARIRRLVFSAFLGLTADLPALPPYLRILGMDKTGEAVLRQAAPTLPIAIRAGDFATLSQDARRIFALEAQADDLYALSLPRVQPCGADYITHLVKIF